MKKLFLFLFVLAIAGTISLQAQGTTTIIVKADDNLVVVPSRAYDVVDTSAVSVVKIFNLTSKRAIQYYTIALDIDTTLHSAVLHKSIDIVLAESWNGTDYITKTTVPFHVTADTLFNFQDITTGSTAPYMKVTIPGVDSLGVQLMTMTARFLNKN